MRQWLRLQWQWVQQQKHWPHPHCHSPVRFLPPHFTSQGWRQRSWATNVIQFLSALSPCSKVQIVQGLGAFLCRFCMFFGFLLHFGDRWTGYSKLTWSVNVSVTLIDRHNVAEDSRVDALLCMWPKCHIVAPSFLSACRGAVFGTLQGNWSRGCSSRFTARVCSCSAESRADCSAVWKELCRWRDQVRNEDLLEAVVVNKRSWWRFCCSLCVVVEDVSSSACVTVKVFPYMTVAALKQQVRETLSQTVNDRGAAGFSLLTPSLLP